LLRPRNVRFWHKADISIRSTNVRFLGKVDTPQCPLSLLSEMASLFKYLDPIFYITIRPNAPKPPTRRARFWALGAATKGGNTMIALTINGQTQNIEVDPNTPLLWALREQVGLTGTKYGCGIAQCGACTVHVDGAATRSCVLPVSAAVGKQITTIEGLAQNGVLHKVQKAWIDHDVPQCGYCQSGMIMAVAALLSGKPKPTDADINATITNICRCGTFQQVREAIHTAANA